AVEVGGGLDGLDHAEGFADRERRADLGQLHVGDVAQTALRVIGDADQRGAVGGRFDPFVGFGVAEIGGNVAHVWKALVNVVSRRRSQRPGRVTNGGLTICSAMGVPRMSTWSPPPIASRATRADPIASLRIGDNVPESTLPASRPSASNTGVSARTTRRSPVLKNTTRGAVPAAFSAASASAPTNPSGLASFTVQPRPAASGEMVAPSSCPYSGYPASR